MRKSVLTVAHPAHYMCRMNADCMSLATGEMAMAVTHPHYGRNAYNPVTTWRHLSIAARDRVGLAALPLPAGMLGSMANLGPGNAFAAAETEALGELAEIAADGLPEIFGQGDGSLPQIAELGFVLDLDDLGGSFFATWTMSFGRMASSPGVMTERNPGSAGRMAAR